MNKMKRFGMVIGLRPEKADEYMAALKAQAALAGKTIEVNEELSEVVPRNEFSWQETRQTDLWDFANLSHRD